MNQLARSTWQHDRHNMNGVQLSKCLSGEYAVHWLTRCGQTVCGDYCRDFDLAHAEFVRRFLQANPHAHAGEQ